MLSGGIVETRVGGKVVAEAPLVSVVVPAYNVAEFISETLDSVLSQTFSSYEVVLVNDGSPDTERLEHVLGPYFDRLVYINQSNGGTSSARNTAIRAARGELIAFLDGDDIWAPEYLAEQVQALNAGGLDLIYADALLFGSVPPGKNQTYMSQCPSTGEVNAESLIDGSCNLITSGTVVRRDKVLEVGMFDEELPRIGFEDFDLWMRLAKAGVRMGYQRKVLLKYRVRENSLSGSNVDRARRSLTALGIVEQKLRLSESELNALRERQDLLSAEFELEKGKFELFRENFKEARQHFQDANQYYSTAKLSALIWMLAVCPRLVSTAFKRLRPTDIAMIGSGNGKGIDSNSTDANGTNGDS